MSTGRLLSLPALALAAALSAGCAREAVNARFDAGQAERMLGAGTNTIEGSAFTRKRSGVIVTAAGEVVYLIPATAYADERFTKLFPRGKLRPAIALNGVEEPPADYARHMRQTKADKRGAFTFENVRPGRYYVLTRLTWNEPRETLPSGGMMYDVVEVRGDNARFDVIVSGN